MHYLICWVSIIIIVYVPRQRFLIKLHWRRTLVHYIYVVLLSTLLNGAQFQHPGSCPSSNYPINGYNCDDSYCLPQVGYTLWVEHPETIESGNDVLR